MTALSGKSRFPCPVCAMPQEVRTTKKEKPYITYNACGVQVFIRGRIGIDEFCRLVDCVQREGLLTRVNEMIRRYRLTCPSCAKQFWVEPRLVETSVFDGSLKGIRCPVVRCGTVLPWKQAS
jgi:hypothetical protein